MSRNPQSVPHSVRTRSDYEPVRNLRTETRFSSWTPLSNKQGNTQLFDERLKLLLHWFDLWTDRQRKQLLLSLLTRCTKSQYCQDLLTEAVPVTQVDFTAVLPRFLSLYVMSFLSPRDLCSAAQVSWHWRVLDCLWASRCIRRGWFLPYSPADKEFGAWKNHYITCVLTVDWLSPQEAAQKYRTLKHIPPPNWPVPSSSEGNPPVDKNSQPQPPRRQKKSATTTDQHLRIFRIFIINWDRMSGDQKLLLGPALVCV
uniref:F-box domain-containing protein n=1 Tax=Stegastes partitus TaxID=144197 RepID=A0A3B5A7Y3_9TELE